MGEPAPPATPADAVHGNVDRATPKYRKVFRSFPSFSAYSMTRFFRWISRCSWVIQMPLAIMYPDDDKTVRLDPKFHRLGP